MIYQSGVAKPEKKKKKGGRGEPKVDKKQEKREARRLARRAAKKGEKPTGDKEPEDAPTAKHEHGSEIIGMKQPVKISDDGQSVSANIPAEVNAYRFLLIDSNRFLQYTDMQMTK